MFFRRSIQFYSRLTSAISNFQNSKFLRRVQSSDLSSTTFIFLRENAIFAKKLPEKCIIRGFTAISINLITINFYQIIATSLVHSKICTVHLHTALYVSASHCLVFLEWYRTVKQSCFNFKHSVLRGRQAKQSNKPKIFTVSSRLNRF